MTSTNFYNELRNTKSSFGNRSAQSARSNSRTKPVTINYQKREKLKQLLITKFMKKYHITTYEPIIDQEVTYFMHKETLLEKDLQNLDNKIHQLLSKKQNLNNLASNLKGDDQNTKNFNEEENLQGSNSAPQDYEIKSKRGKTASVRSRRDNDTLSVRSGVSGASRLSNVNCKKKDLDEDDLDLLSHTSEPVERINFDNEKDEWDAINKYNQKVFEQDKINEKQKDKEVKKRTKEDLDNQIRQKMYRQFEERMKNKEYDKITIHHVEAMNKMEQDRKRELKEKMLREKENRDAQRMDEKKRKKIEQLKDKKYDKELRKIQ
jgi:hypothetical protein